MTVRIERMIWWRIELPKPRGAVFAVVERDCRIVAAAPIGRWMVGKPVNAIIRWVLGKRGEMVLV